MRQSRLFWRTLRADPADAEAASHRLLVRAGLAQRFASGIYGLTPLGLVAERRIEAVVREELGRIGAQEVRLPFVQPLELWRRSGRGGEDLPELARFKDRRGEEFALALTAEEAMTELVRLQGVTAAGLPLLLTQIGTKFRDELRPRGGLLRLREFSMQDAYSFDVDEAGLALSFGRVAGAYRRIFHRLALDVREVTAASGMMGGSGAVEFQLPTAAGEDEIVTCACGFSANREAAARRPRPQLGRPSTGLELVQTPGATTIAELCRQIACRPEDTLKAVFYDGLGATVVALVAGDRQVDEEKLGALLGVALRPLTATQASERGLVAGYAGPVGLQPTGETVLVADLEVGLAQGLVCGANEPGRHIVGAVPGVHFTWQREADITLVAEGDACPQCGGALHLQRSLELGHIFRLGTRYAEALGLGAAGRDNVVRPLWMGSYGIGISRLLAAVVEAHHDDAGIVWPEAAAPFAIHVVQLGGEAEDLVAQIERGREAAILVDDRRETAGVKFQDADLLGLPWRLTVGRRALAEGGVELRRRSDGATALVPLGELAGRLETLLAGPSD